MLKTASQISKNQSDANMVVELPYLTSKLTWMVVE